MADPKEEVRRSTEFNPEVLDDFGKIVNRALSSKRVEGEPAHQPKTPASTRARRPRSGRSGSDSNASRRTKGH
jgi:hypothetical protein